MKKFQFSTKHENVFNGDFFYNVYKNAEFLRKSENVETILSKGYELRNMLKDIEPGKHVEVSGMLLENNSPLIVRKTGPNVAVDVFEFTLNRLSGLVAAYAFEYRVRFPVLNVTEALALGLTWDNKNRVKCRLFLSAVSGTHHFYKQFSFWPLVCGLRKLQLKKIPIEPVIKMAKIKNHDGVQMATELMRNLDTVKLLWSHFPGASNNDLKKQLESLPPELKNMLK